MSNDVQKMENKKIKVLFFVDRFLRGGIQTFIWNHIVNIDRTKFSIDCLVLDDGATYDMENELRKKGIKIYKLEKIWPNSIKGYIEFIQASKKFFMQHHDYDILHIHSSSKAFPLAYYAKKYGVLHIIGHSHNIGFQTNNVAKKIVGDLLKIPYRMICNTYMACSMEAAQWLFGDDVAKKNKVHCIKNGIDIEKYRYNPEIRQELRKKYDLENNFVIGNVARFSKQKNHQYLIDIFYEIKKMRSNSKLLLVGCGELEEAIHDKVKELGLTDSVIFVGFCDDVYKYMQIMDCFVFPSLFEGLGIVLIEAQASGLKCFTTASTVPREVDISGNVEFISLNESPNVWAKKIIKVNVGERCDISSLKNSEYNVKQTVDELEKVYTNIVNGWIEEIVK